MEGNATGMHRAVFVVLCMLAWPASAEKISIAATVNDAVITSLDVSERSRLMMANAQIADTPENVKRLTPKVIQQLVDEALQLQEAQRM